MFLMRDKNYHARKRQGEKKILIQALLKTSHLSAARDN